MVPAAPARSLVHVALSRVLFAAAVLLAGCVNNEYQIEMEAQGDQVHRALTAWKHAANDQNSQYGPLPQGELDALAAVYEVPAPRSAPEQVRFEGDFGGVLPADVGGAGRFQRWEATLGSVTAYVERFRGNDDLLASVETRLADVDTLVDLLRDWSAQEAAGSPQRDALAAFIDGPLRQDAKNLSLYLWTFRAATDLREEPEQTPEFVARLGLVLVERGYLDADEWPELLATFGGQNPEPSLAFACRILQRRAGLETPLPEILPALGSVRDLEAALNAAVQSSEFYRELKSTAEAEGETPPQPDEALSLLLQRATGFSLSGHDALTVRFRAADPPYQTNGEWNAQEHCVEWTRTVEIAGQRPQHVLPPVLYAAWSMPDDETQERLFGRTVLAGEQLGEYVVWRNGLTADDRHEWEQYLDGVVPGPDLASVLAAFRFSSQPNEDVAIHGRDLLQQAIEAQ